MRIRNDRFGALLTAGLLWLGLVVAPALAPVWAQEEPPQATEATAPAEPGAAEAAEPPTEPATEADPGAAGEDSAAAPGITLSDEDAEELRDEILDRYQALPARSGVLLVPEDDVPGISSIEIADGQVAVNGERVSPTILRSWLGDEAEPLLALAALEAGAARELLQVDARPAGEAPMTAGGGDDDDAFAEEDDEEADAGVVRLGDQVKFGGDIVIEANEIAREAVAIGGDVIVRGRVENDVSAIGGRVEVEGEVGGEVVSVLGGVILGPESEVDGNVTSVGSSVQRAPGARVGGEITDASIAGPGVDVDFDSWRDAQRYRPSWMFGANLNAAYWTLIRSALLALLACMALLVARPTLEGVGRRVGNFSDFLVAFLVGAGSTLLIAVVLVILTVLLVISIVGCLALPLLPFLVIGLLIAALFGYAGVALRVGRWLETRFGWRLESPYVAVLLGVGLIEVWRMIASFLHIFGGWVWVFATMFTVLGVVVELGAWFAGFGAVLMGWLEGRRERRLPPPPPGGAPAGGGPGYGPYSGDPYSGPSYAGTSRAGATPQAGAAPAGAGAVGEAAPEADPAPAPEPPPAAEARPSGAPPAPDAPPASTDPAQPAAEPDAEPGPDPRSRD